MRKTKIDLVRVKKLASLLTTLDDIATDQDIPHSTFRQIAAKDPEVRRAIERGQATGRLHLRMAQFRQATGFGAPAVQMSIFLGKNWLGQVDKTEIVGSISIEDASASATDMMLKGLDTNLLLPDERVELNELCDRIGSHGIALLSEDERSRFVKLVQKGAPQIIEGEIVEDEQQLLPPPDEKAA